MGQKPRIGLVVRAFQPNGFLHPGRVCQPRGILIGLQSVHQPVPINRLEQDDHIQRPIWKRQLLGIELPEIKVGSRGSVLLISNRPIFEALRAPVQGRQSGDGYPPGRRLGYAGKDF